MKNKEKMIYTIDIDKYSSARRIKEIKDIDVVLFFTDCIKNKIDIINIDNYINSYKKNDNEGKLYLYSSLCDKLQNLIIELINYKYSNEYDRDLYNLYMFFIEIELENEKQFNQMMKLLRKFLIIK